MIKSAVGSTLTAYVDAVSTRAALEPLPKAGPVPRRRRQAPGVTEWTLSNGVRVVLEPTTFKQDEILFRAVQPRRHVARQRSGLRCGGNRGSDCRRRRPRHAQSRST